MYCTSLCSTGLIKVNEMTEKYDLEAKPVRLMVILSGFAQSKFGGESAFGGLHSNPTIAPSTALRTSRAIFAPIRSSLFRHFDKALL